MDPQSAAILRGKASTGNAADLSCVADIQLDFMFCDDFAADP